MRSFAQHLPVLALYALVTLVMTYPAVFYLEKAIIGDYVDSYLNTWIIAWDLHKIFRGEFRTLFDANIFFPQANTLAYSEHMLGTALLAAPLQWIRGNPVLTFNVSVLLAFFLSAVSMYFLVRHLTGNRSAALVSGLIFAFLPWRMVHVPHLQLLSAQWLPLTFLFLHRYTRSRSPRDLAGAALFWVLTFYACGYYALFLSCFLVLFYLLFWLEFPAGRRPLLIHSFWIFGAAFLIILPGYWPYLELKREFAFARPFDDAVFFSADVTTFLSLPPQNWVWGRWLGSFRKPEGDLFLGAVPLILALGGLGSRLIKKNLIPRFSSLAPRFYFYLLVLSFLFCLGPIIHWGGWKLSYGPYWILYKLIPGFDGLRVPARFIIMVQLAVSVLGGYGLARLLEKMRRPWARGLLVFGVALLVLLEYASFPIRISSLRTGPDFPPVYSWLARQPGDFAVLELPLPTRAEEHWREAAYVYYSTTHWKRLVNGYSGFFPPGYLHFYREGLKGFPSRETLQRIQARQVRYVIVHFQGYSPVEGRAIRDCFDKNSDLFILEERFQGDWVYRNRAGT